MPVATSPASIAVRNLARDLEPGNHERATAALSTLLNDLRIADGKLFSEYVESSPLCAELFKLWESLESKENTRLATSILDALAAVAEGRFEAGARTAKTRSSIAGRVISERLPTLYRYFNSERDGLLRACLHLLTAVTSVSLPSASQLFRAFNWEYKNFLRLVTRRSQSEKRKEDVRHFFKSFGLAFLRWKDAALSASVLNIRGFVSQVFGNLHEDWPEDIVSFLKDIQDYLLEQRQIPRPSKLYFFNGYALRHICSLLSSEAEEVVQCAKEFLIACCTNTFLYRQPQHQMLLETCLHLRPLQGPQEAVVLAIVESHPALHAPFCSRLNLGLQPTLSLNWLRNMSFIIKLLEMDASSYVESQGHAGAQDDDDYDTGHLKISASMGDVVPKTVQKTLLSQALQSTNAIILFVALRVIASIVLRVERMSQSGAWTNDKKESWQASIQQQLPDLNTLVLLWQKLIKDERVELEDLLADTDVEAAHLTESLALPIAGFRHNMLFPAWCKVVSAYCKVLPLSMLDVKFDWSKLLIATSSQFLSAPDASKVSPVVLERLLSSVQCVDMAICSSGHTEGMQLSKSQLAWIETMLRVRTSQNLQLGNPLADTLASAIDEVLQRCFHHMSVFTDEEDVEACVWIAQLRRHPACLSFFCFVLHLVASKPGTFASLYHDTIQGSVRGMADRSTSDWGRPSLFLLTCIKQLSQKETQAFTLAQDSSVKTKNEYVMQCALLVKSVVCQLGLWLPHGAFQLEVLVRELGSWNVNRESSADSGSAEVPLLSTVEEHRQAVIQRLQQLRAPWGRLSASSECEEKNVNVAQCFAAVKESLQDVVENINLGGTASVRKGKRDSISALQLHLDGLVRKSSAYIHCCVYVLLEGIYAACGLWTQPERCYQYVFLLSELLPCVISARSLIVDYTIRHPVWTKLLKCSAVADARVIGSQNVCVTLAVIVLCELLRSFAKSSFAKARSKAVKLCKSIVLPLLNTMKFGPDMASDIADLAKSFSDDASQCELSHKVDPAHAAASGVISLCSQIGLLDHLISDAFPKLDPSVKLVVIKILLTSREDGNCSTTTFMHLDVARRAELLHWLVQEQLSSESSQDGMLQMFIASDAESFLQFAATATLKCLWPKSKDNGPALHGIEFALLDKTCRINPVLRRALIRRLDWGTVDPNVMLRLAVTLAPLETLLPWLNDDALSQISPEALCPLPSYKELHQLLTLHPSTELKRILQAAAIKDTARNSSQSPLLPLQLELMCGNATKIGRAVKQLLSSSDSRCRPAEEAQQIEWQAALKEEIDCICDALMATNGPTERFTQELQLYLESLSQSHSEGASKILDRLLMSIGSFGIASWRSTTSRVLEQRPVPDWCLTYAISWHGSLDHDADGYQQFMAAIRSDYKASLTAADRSRRQLILLSAGFTCADQGKAVDPWSFRLWCGALPYWSAETSWSWVLETQRVRATYDRFWYSRPISEKPMSLDAAIEKDLKWLENSYDIGYIAPFVAGQLRALWADHGEGNLDSQRVIGPILSSMISGGILELLLLACACTDSMIRASACESLSVIIAFGSFWDDAASPKVREGEQLSKARLPFKELPQFMRLLRCARDSLEPDQDEHSAPPLLPTLVASFLCACIPVLLHPQHDLYMRLGMFFLGQCYLSLDDIPLFYKMILSGDPAVDTEKARLWMFRVIRRGLRVVDDTKAIHCDSTVESIEGNGELTTRGNHQARVALAHRYAVQWLLSFASSSELSSFPVWSEAVGCMEAAFADPANGLQASHRFGICEWIIGQISREWFGLGKLQATYALTRLIDVLAYHDGNDLVADAIGEGFAAELLGLFGATEAVLRRFSALAETIDAQHAPTTMERFWLLCCRLSDLVNACSLKSRANGADIAAECTSFSAQIGSLVQHLVSLSSALTGIQEISASSRNKDGVALSEDLGFVAFLVRRLGHEKVLHQVLKLLQACPLSRTLHSLVVHLLQHSIEVSHAKTKTNDFCIPSLTNLALSETIAESVLSLLGKMLAEVQVLADFSDAKLLKESVVKAIRAFLMLPYSPMLAWRVHTVCASILLCLFPDISLDEDLLRDLPSPEVVLLVGQSPNGDADKWSVSAWKLLKQVITSLSPGLALVV